MNFSGRISIAAVVIALSSCDCGNLAGRESLPSRICTSFDGGARANTALTMEATFDSISGCGSAGRCAVAVSGNTIVIDAGAYVCPTGTNPGGVTPSPATCNVPPLAPGNYAIELYGGSITVVADGGGSTSCP